MKYFSEFINTFKNSYIQTFDDRKRKLDGYTLSFPVLEIKKRWDELHEKNINGMGVYFTPNSCSNGRKESDIKSIDWIYCDIDDVPKEESMALVDKCECPPNVIVESFNGYHLYWRCHFNSKEDFSEVISGIQLHFNGDPAISSINEVLRLPGFYHVKKDPYMVKIVRFEDCTEYIVDELKKCFPKPEDVFQRKYGVDEIEVIKNIPIKKLLDELGVKYDNKNRIIEGNEVTSGRINIQGNYVNRFSGKEGGGSTIQVLMHYKNISARDAIIYLKKMAGIDEKSVIKNSLKRKEVDFDVIDQINTKPFTWGTKELDKIISPIERYHYIVLGGESGAGKSAFSFFVAMKNAELGHKVVYLSLEMTSDAILTRIARSFAGIDKSEWRDKGLITPHQKELYKKKKGEIKNIQELIALGFPKGVPANIENLKTLILEAKPDLLFIDNFDLIERDEKLTDTQNESQIAKFLMDFTNDYNIPIILLHHFRKKSGDKKSNSREMDDFKGSAKIIHNCDTALIGVREPYSNDMTAEESARFTIIQKKDRDFGINGLKTVYFYKGDFYDEFKSDLLETHGTLVVGQHI